jgi:hypothetical protein
VSVRARVDRLELMVPGLLGPLPGRPVGLRTPTLDLLLSRAEPDEGQGGDLSELLCSAFGVQSSAPFALAADDPGWDHSGWWMHAEPVHLRPDRDLLRLYDARHLGISRAEADALVGELNRTFADDGLQVHAPVADRWYLRCEQAPDMRTTPLGAVVGRHIDGALPSGPDARRWAALMSEMEMCLFQAEPNRRREAEGRPAVNGLWSWGGGVWHRPARAPDLVAGSSPLLLGLARAAGRGVEPRLDSDVAALLQRSAGRVLVLWRALEEALLDRDLDTWAGAAAALERWAAPLPAVLRGGALGELRLCPGGDRPCLVLRPGALRWYRGRFWRRTRSIAERATPPPAAPRPPDPDLGQDSAPDRVPD